MGVYGLVKGFMAIAGRPGEVAKEIQEDLRTLYPDAPDWQIGLGTFGDLGITFLNAISGFFGGPTVQKKPLPPGAPPAIEPTDKLKELFALEPLALNAAFMAGGMVLAGLNPGEVLSGIGRILDGLVPL